MIGRERIQSVFPQPLYNPDWAIAFREGSVKHVYFVAESKGNDL